MPPKMLPMLAGALLLCSVAVMKSATATTDTTLDAIAQYRQWTRINEKPIPVVNEVTGGD